MTNFELDERDTVLDENGGGSSENGNTLTEDKFLFCSVFFSKMRIYPKSLLFVQKFQICQNFSRIFFMIKIN